MPKIKAGSTAVGAEATGFDIYEGPEPKPGVYNAVIKQINMRMSKNENLYYNILFEWADNEGEKAQYNGYTTFQMLVPGDHELQQVRENQLLKAVAGKFPADVVFAELDSEEKGKVTKIGTKKPDGTAVKVAVGREPDNRTPGEFRLRVNDIFPRAKSDEDIEEEEAGAAVAPDGEVLDIDEDATDEESEEETSEEVEFDEDTLRSELSELKLPALKKTAREDYGMSPADLKGYKSVEGLVEAIIDSQRPVDEDGEEETGDEHAELREELGAMKLPLLKKRAREEYGFTATDLKDMKDIESVVEAIIGSLAGGGFEEDEDGLITYTSAMGAGRDALLAKLAEQEYDPDDFEDFSDEELVDQLVEDGIVAENDSKEPPF